MTDGPAQPPRTKEWQAGFAAGRRQAQETPMSERVLLDLMDVLYPDLFCVGSEGAKPER